MSESLDRELSEYLADRRAEKDKGITLESVHKTVTTLADVQVAHEQKDDARWGSLDDQLKSQRMRTENLETRLARVEDHEETTGSHLINLASQVGKRPSLPPVLQVINWIGTKVAEAKVVIIVSAAAAALMHLAHLAHWLR